jgi:glycosyltransferase involved in cell wall biosynthesis
VPVVTTPPAPAHRVLFFGTYDVRTHPRVQALRDGLAAAGDAVDECNVPLGLDTGMRVRILTRPYLLPLLAGRIAMAWLKLWRRSRLAPAPDAVVVGYLGHFDVHLARRLWPRTPLALDHMISAADTALDRGTRPGRLTRVLERLDRAALTVADVPFVDTPEHREIVPADLRSKVVVVPVGAPDYWFREPQPRTGGPLRVAFFGLYTPLQGAVTIGEAIAHVGDTDIEFSMIGNGQDLAATRTAAGDNPRVSWRHWVDASDLPDLVSAHDVCLGVFGTGPKARRVVPNKVYQGAAAGCAVVTSDTPPQRSMLAGAAVFVPAGDSGALAATLRGLAGDRDQVETLRRAAYERADAAFRPARIVGPLRDRLNW